ncbi:hypothetical protein LOAG_16577 [Loa loa]|uniref:14_3_3 domain-containing protein n=1 Tax=Loa loa TaxID=7209 RepID=A0A1I7VQW7_LOALO|nr:hypothetical protein LOAG_16577 [Loa loa]EJD76506.1 hypothetical protein LOAG_16577 [Loa loa]
MQVKTTVKCEHSAYGRRETEEFYSMLKQSKPVDEGKEAVITLAMYETDLELVRLSQDSHSLDQLLSKTKTQPPRPTSHVTGMNALQAAKGYDIATENYKVIRRLLMEKYELAMTIATELAKLAKLALATIHSDEKIFKFTMKKESKERRPRVFCSQDH